MKAWCWRFQWRSRRCHASSGSTPSKSRLAVSFSICPVKGDQCQQAPNVSVETLFDAVAQGQLTLASSCGEQQVRHERLSLGREPPVRTSLMDCPIMTSTRRPVIGRRRTARSRRSSSWSPRIVRDSRISTCRTIARMLHAIGRSISIMVNWSRSTKRRRSLTLLSRRW